MFKELVLLSTDPLDVQFATSLCSKLGAELFLAKDAHQGVIRMTEPGERIYMIDASTAAKYQAFETAVQERVGLFSDQVNPNHFHYLLDKDLPDAKYLIKSPLASSMIFKPYGESDPAVKMYSSLLKMIHTGPYPELKNFFGEDARIQKIQFVSATQKQQAVEAVKNFVLTCKFKSRIAGLVASATDELLMNAMYDAPVDEQGHHLHSGTSRVTEINLEGRRKVELSLGYDGEYLAVTVKDLFGSMKRPALLEALARRFRDQEYKIRLAAVNAGIGLATTFRAGANLMITCHSGQRTDVTVLFRRTPNVKEFREQFRFLGMQFFS